MLSPDLMTSSSSSHQQNGESNAFSGIEPSGNRRKVSESSRLFDVFINHRGPDVKQTLATELYNSLRQLEINAFIDSQEKELGNWFPSTIETAIRSAKVHIAIFSKRYADSPWCLAELVLMLRSEAKIIPVFYEVGTWELSHIEKGVYAKAFSRYKEKGRYLEKLTEWKEALNSVSFMAGEEFGEKIDSSSDCKTIVAAVEKEVQRKRCLLVAKYPVGLNSVVEDFERRCLDELVQDIENQCCLLETKNKPIVVAIFGMGGVGKTTLAKELVNRKRSKYSGSRFLFDVREASVRSELPHLQSQLVKDLLHTEQNFKSIEEGKSYLNDHLPRSPLNFLIVVDDIDHVEQLDALLIMDILSKLGNSLVIVTTRDVGVVITAGITVGYSLKGMDRNNGSRLFCWHAFDQPFPCAGYEALVDQFVDVCGGLPLSLLVLGRLVHGRDRGFWQSNLKKAKKTLPLDVKKRLKISFDALDEEEKQVFMDIACFFLGQEKWMAERILEGSGWDAQNSLQTLKDKCLVEEINYSDKRPVLRMHDHLRDLGREMALELNFPRRLWHSRDLEPLEFMGLKTILAKTNTRCFHFILDHSAGWEITFFLCQSETSASSLLWLELREIYKDKFEDSDNMTQQPSLSALPEWIPLQHLQFLKIVGGSCKTLWENRRQILPYQQLLFQRASGTDDPIKLRELIIGKCPELEELSSLSRLNCMEKTEIWDCNKLQNITVPTSLTSLSVQSCSDLQRIVGSDNLINLTELVIRECPELEENPSLSSVRCMKKIEIHCCEKLRNLTLPTSLTSLSVKSCSNLQRIVGFADLIKLTELIIMDCPKLEEFPSLSRVSCMEKIEIHCFEKLVNITLPTSVTSLSVKSCRNLQRIVGFSDLIKLTELIIMECPELEEFPSLSRVSCVKKIEIHCFEKLVNIILPTTLISLSIHKCRNLQRVAVSGDFITLTELIINECPKIEELPCLSRLSYMEMIDIRSCEKLEKIMLPMKIMSLFVESCRDFQRLVGSGDLIEITELFFTEYRV